VIIRPRPHWLHLLFVRRGSILPRILPQLLFTTLLSCGVVLMHGQLFHWKVTLTSAPFSLMGVALAIFLGFRNNSSYDRYWEGRKLWGRLLVESRTLARQAITFPRASVNARPFVLGLIAFAYASRNQLRGRPRSDEIEGLLPAPVMDRMVKARFAPIVILLWLGSWIRERCEHGELDPMLAQRMDVPLSGLSEVIGGCERIASTPLPFTYSVILHRTIYLYCMMLPFGLVDGIGMMTPVVVAFVSYTFFALEALSDEIEEPFGLAPNDLALDAMAAGIDSSLREMLGETPAPAHEPNKDFILT
jgi:ion channel-forming bestrophin family protein